MLYFIPAWYQQNHWCENEQYWYTRRARTEFDDTVKHIQLFHRSKAYPFQIMLLSYAPNFRHFLHRQSVLHAPYWSCFDAIQEVRKKKVKMFSFHNLNWPEHVEFIYSSFALIAMREGEKYAQVEFGEDGNLIQVDIYQKGNIQRRNIYDDRGFVSSSTLFENGYPVYQDYLTDIGTWKIRHYFADGHVEVNPKSNTYLLVYQEKEYTGSFSKDSYEGMQQLIEEVLMAYLKLVSREDMFCVAVHELHNELLYRALDGRKMILSFYGERYDIKNKIEKAVPLINASKYIITDALDNLKRIQRRMEQTLTKMTDITPFDSRVDLGISQQLTVQKILVPVDDMEEEWLEEVIARLGEYLPSNDKAQIHLFTRMSEYGRKKQLLEITRKILKKYGMEEDWAQEEEAGKETENMLDSEETVPIRFFVEQCVDELSVSKCIREQRLIVDMRKNSEIYLRITGISVGIPQIVYRDSQFVEDGNNGLILKNMDMLGGAIAYYLDNLKNWNEAMVYSFEISKKYTTDVLIEKWKEVIEFVGNNSDITTGNKRLE